MGEGVMAMGCESEHLHLVALLRANKGVAWHRIASVVEAGGTAEGLVLGEVKPPNDFVRHLVESVSAEHLENAHIEVASWGERKGMAVWSVLDERYPSRLRTIYNRPPFLFCRGNWLDQVDSQGLAVVGTRQPTEEGLGRARHIARQLAKHQVTVISGLALGIDGAAHRAALETGGRTVAVLGSGLDTVYPPEHKDLAEEMVGSGGALLSPFVPRQAPARTYTFQIRNAVMSGLSLGTIVIEAGPTSGAKMQARLALEHGRPVFLPRSLIAHYPWARDYAERGRYGVRAIVIADVNEVMQALESPEPLDLQLEFTLDAE